VAQFSVYSNPRGSRVNAPYLLDVQTDLLNIATRVVVPLAYPKAFGPPAKRLNPLLKVDGETYVMVTSEIANLPTRELRKPVADLSSERDAIRNALDLLLIGF
jgi:toxin CcdB